MQTTTNYGFNKPEVTDNYNVERLNENFDIIDRELKTVAEKAESSTTHPTNKENPHGVTAGQVGLGNVPNVATNDQTPTYVVATENAALSSGEKLSAAFGKIAKAISSLISHLSDTVGHITSAEREAWNAKANGTHTHTKSQISDFPTSMTPTAHTHTKSQITDFPTSMTPTAHTHTKSQISDFPSSMPASDVYSWAKASSKPSYTKSEVGLGNVDNTADSAKSVKYATSAGSASSATSATNATNATYAKDSTVTSATLKNFYAGTSALTAGSSSLATGTIYIQYE